MSYTHMCMPSWPGLDHVRSTYSFHNPFLFLGGIGSSAALTRSNPPPSRAPRFSIQASPPRSLSLSFFSFFSFFFSIYGFRYERLFILKSTHQGVILVLLDKSDKKRVLVYNNAIALLVCWFRQTNEQNEMRRRRSRPCSRCCRSRCVGVGVGCWFGCRRRAHTRQKHV